MHNSQFHFIVTPAKEHRFQEVTVHLLYELRLTSRPFYKPHHHQEKWVTKMERALDWDLIWDSVHNPLTLVNTRSIVWEQIHLNFYTTYNYNKWHNQAAICPFCSTVPTNIFHIIMDCPLVLRLWLDLEPVLQAIFPTPVTFYELAFGIPGNTPAHRLRNYLTFILREVITNFESTAYYNKRGFDNITPLKAFYNAKLSTYIGHWYYYYTNINRLDLFDKYITFTDVVAVVRPDNSLYIKDVYAL